MRILALGGSTRAVSFTWSALQVAARHMETLGCAVRSINVSELSLPPYREERDSCRSPEIRNLLSEFTVADGFIFASPAYHGSISGALKNVLDYVDLLKSSTPPFLGGKPVAIIAVGQGTIAPVLAARTLVDITHALRGLVVPSIVAICNGDKAFSPAGQLCAPEMRERLTRVADDLNRYCELTTTRQRCE